jgi:hypothetical protein
VKTALAGAIAGQTTCVATNGGTAVPIGTATAVPTAATTATAAATAATTATAGPTGTATTAAGTINPATGPAPGTICVNPTGGLEFGRGATLGTTTINAVADYPYTRGEHPQVGATGAGGTNGLTKVFTSLFEKSVTYTGPVAGPAGTSTYIVTVTARDICGNPLVGEPIQVYTFGNPGAVVLAPLSAGSIATSSGTTSATVTVGANGTATLSLEVLGQAVGNAGVTVKVVFPFEGIERFATVIAPTTPTTTVTQLYSPGYQQVGGPAGSNFGVAEAVFSYSSASNSYTNVSASSTALSSAAPACTGYWAYFAAPASVTLPASSKPGDTATCTLAAGWNLVGNPFASAAALPSGTTAYHWNGTSYDVVGQIPLGGAVWIYSAAAGTVTLTAT